MSISVFVTQKMCRCMKMYRKVCVIFVIICVLYGLIQCRAEQTTDNNNYRQWAEYTRPISKINRTENKLYPAGNMICCFLHELLPSHNNIMNCVFVEIDSTRADNCSNYFDPSECVCFITMSRSPTIEGKSYNIPTVAYIATGVAVIIIVTIQIICIVLIKKRKSALSSDKYRKLQSSHRKEDPNSVEGLSLKGNSKSYSNLSTDHSYTEYDRYEKMPKLRHPTVNEINKREESHIYHSLDNLHITTPESADRSIQIRAPYPLPHSDVKSANNNLIFKYSQETNSVRMQMGSRQLPKPPRVTPKIDSPVNVELTNVLKKRRINTKESPAKHNNQQSTQVPAPPRKPKLDINVPTNNWKPRLPTPKQSPDNVSSPEVPWKPYLPTPTRNQGRRWNATN